MNNWQPIDTAPKDGTEVLVFRMDCGCTPIIHIAFYKSEKEWEQGEGCYDETKEEFIGWWSYTENSVSFSKLEDYTMPTHWMPLPELPKN